MIDDISLYKSFYAAAGEKSISSAAKKLFKSQPALSADIKRLEETLGVKLFFRTNRGIKLTGEGELLYSYVSRSASLLSSGEEKLREVTNLLTGSLRIGASDMTLRFFLLDYIERFRHEFPDVRISVTNAPTPKTIDALRSGTIDFAAVSLCGDEEQYDDVEFLPVREIHDIFICSPELSVSRRKNAGAGDLSEYPLIMLDGRTSTHRYVSEKLGGTLKSADIELATSDLLLEFANRGLGVASIVEDFAADAISRGEVAKIDFTPELPPRMMAAAYLKKIPLCAAAKKMISMFPVKTR